MREGCSCGAWIHATRRNVILWREQHACPERVDPPDHIGAGAQVELASTPPIGFHIQPTNHQEPYEDD